MEEVRVHVNYCAPCGYKANFDELANIVKKRVPHAVVTGSEDDRSGAFELAINGNSVHSRLQTFAFPDYESTADVVHSVAGGGSVPSKLKHQPITDCKVS